MHSTKRLKENKIVKEALGVLIGPTEIAPELLIWIKEIQAEQRRMNTELVSCRLQFKAVESLRLEEVKDELRENEKKLKTHN